MAAKGKVPACIVCSRQLEGGLLEWPQFPFCSQRCKLVDLGRWFNEEHRLSRPLNAADFSGMDEMPGDIDPDRPHGTDRAT